MKWADTQGDTHRDTQEIHVPQKMFRLTDEQICKLKKKVSELRGCSQTDLIRGFIDSLDEEPPDTQGDTHRGTQGIHGAERSSGPIRQRWPRSSSSACRQGCSARQEGRADSQAHGYRGRQHQGRAQGAQGAPPRESPRTLALESTEQKLLMAKAPGAFEVLAVKWNVSVLRAQVGGMRAHRGG